jgi:acetyl-CoA carboxylase biotin carboxyl carrier protein
MEMTPETIGALLDAFDRSGWREMTVTIGSDRLHVSRDPSPDGSAPDPEAAAPAPAVPAAPAAPAELPPGVAVEAPSVGLFSRAPAPGAPPFVEVGQRVAAGDTVAIVEVMALMNHVVAPADGVVAAILVDNGAPVEFGQPLVIVDPEG